MSLIVQIHKKFKDFQLNINFKTNGRPLGILGASGSGKSMTLQCIAGIITPDEGYIKLKDKVLFDSENGINLRPQERNVGYLFQNYALFPNMTVEENIAIGMKESKDKRAAVINKLLQDFQLEGLEKRYPSQLSGGQQQRVALARILAYEPDILLLDEPFSALDAYLKEELQIQLHDLLGPYKGESILVTHSRNEVYKLTKDLIVMDHGKILVAGGTKDIFLNPPSIQVARLTGCKNISRAKKISRNQVEALDWGIILTVKEPVPDDLVGIGIRAHSFVPFYNSSSGITPEGGFYNKIPCKVIKITESPFEWGVIIATKTSSTIWWKINKNQLYSQLSDSFPEFITVAPEDILLLVDQSCI